jgi:hypothetical protein
MLILKNQIILLMSSDTGKLYNESYRRKDSNMNQTNHRHTAYHSFRTSNVPAALLKENSTKAYISYQPALSESLPQAWSITRTAEYHTKLIPEHIFTETRTQGSSRVCDPTSCNLLAETNNFIPGAVLLSRLVSSYKIHL